MPPNPRVVRAFRAMRDLGISENKVKPVLKHLLKLYDKNWDVIEEENYRILADAIFDSEEVEDVPSRNKLEYTEQERVLREEAQEQDEPGRALKRLCLNYQGQATESCNNSTHLVGTSLITPKDEPIELPAVQPQNHVRSMVSTKPVNNGNRSIESQHVSCHLLDRSNVKQPVSPERSSQAVPKEQIVGGQISGQPKEGPSTGDTLVIDLPFPVMHPETSKGEDSSRESCPERVQNGSVPITAESVESLGAKDTNNAVPATTPDESNSQLEVASSTLGEVKIRLSYNISSLRPDFQVPSLDTLVKMVEDRYLESYKQLDPNFSLMKLMKDMCESVLELGFESCNKSEERN
ncbi:hypothetical protein ACH5RR_020324 [Cinchona calisaya]|uniref:WIYLD domain-containing protein n=1 Tax=Cinchona calisaya TaxID=153742 RepID=A0ABD2ZHG3_9GENT